MSNLANHDSCPSVCAQAAFSSPPIGCPTARRLLVCLDALSRIIRVRHRGKVPEQWRRRVNMQLFSQPASFPPGPAKNRLTKGDFFGPVFPGARRNDGYKLWIEHQITRATFPIPPALAPITRRRIWGAPVGFLIKMLPASTSWVNRVSPTGANDVHHLAACYHCHSTQQNRGLVGSRP